VAVQSFNFKKWAPKCGSNPEMRNFSKGQENPGIARKRTLLYVAQAIPKIYPPQAGCYRDYGKEPFMDGKKDKTMKTKEASNTAGCASYNILRFMLI